MRLAGSSWVWATATGRAAAPPPLGVHNGHVPGLRWAPRGSGAAHCPPWRSATLTQMEHVRTLAFGDALRAAETHPIMPDTLGVCVVTVLGPPVVVVGARGVSSSGHTWPSTRCACPDAGRCSTCCQDPPRHARHARRARGDRARAARKSVAAKGGDIQRAVQFEPIVVRAEAFRRARVGTLSNQGISNLYQGGRYARIPFRRPPPDLPLQYPVHVGHVPSRAARLTLRRTRTHSSSLWRL